METTYWRGLFAMDPANPRISLPTATRYLDAYLAAPQAHAHSVEASALRHIAARFDELNTKAAELLHAHDAITKAQPTDVRIDVPRPGADPALVADAEIRRLKDELAKANAELERIRKRLAQPGRPPDPR